MTTIKRVASSLFSNSHRFPRHFSTSVSPIASLLSDSSLLKQQGFIDGAWVNSSSQQTLLVRSPTDCSVLGSIPAFTGSEVRGAISSAERAQAEWSHFTPKQRSEVLYKWYELMIKHKKDLAIILTSEQGKPLAEAEGEIVYSAGFLHVYAGEAERILGEYLPPTPHSRIAVMRTPVGVVGSITPWNFPSAMITRKCGAALAAGCSVVLKPSELTPFSAFALAELSVRAGLPKGLFNVVTGEAPVIGGELVKSHVVKKITFTGSTRVGKLLMQQSADTVKRMSMELGGNAPFIVFGDASIDSAVAGLLLAKFRNTGQTCVTANRVFVHASVYDQFAAKLQHAVSAMKAGSGLIPGNSLGPLINQAAVDKVKAHIDDAVKKGGKVMIGGQPYPQSATHPSPFFFQPTIVLNANDTMRVAQEETFGPVAFLFKFDSDEEVLKAANNTHAGLAAYYYTNNISRMFRLSEQLQYGMIGVNTGSVSSPTAPFGGVKESGFGREGSHHGLTDYLDIKTAHFGL